MAHGDSLLAGSPRTGGLLRGPGGSNGGGSSSSGSHAAAAVVLLAAVLLTIGVVAAPILKDQASYLWRPTWGRSTTFLSSRAAEAAAAPIVRDLAAWERAPGAAFVTPQSQCTVYPDGDVALGPPPAPGLPPFLTDLDPARLPSKREACGHCSADKCGGPRLPHTCCGVCQFDSRFCAKLYPGENRSELALTGFMAQGHQLQDFLPCELFQRIRGRTLWLMGDSQTWQFYYTLECFLREFAPSLIRSDPVPEGELDKLSTARQMYCDKWWSVPPECLELAHGTRVCVVRADLASDVHGALATLQAHVPGFERDLLVYNTGLHYFEFDGPQVCNATTCGVPGPGSKYVRELGELADYVQAHRRRLPATVWMDTTPQHFPGTGYYVGEFRSAECAPWAAWERGEALPRAGGMWNVAAAPFVRRLADAHMRTWEASIPFWSTHMPSECTHWCQPSLYHVWLYLLNGVLRDARLGDRVAVLPAPRLDAAQEQARPDR